MLRSCVWEQREALVLRRWGGGYTTCGHIIAGVRVPVCVQVWCGCVGVWGQCECAGVGGTVCVSRCVRVGGVQCGGYGVCAGVCTQERVAWVRTCARGAADSRVCTHASPRGVASPARGWRPAVARWTDAPVRARAPAGRPCDSPRGCVSPAGVPGTMLTAPWAAGVREPAWM